MGVPRRFHLRSDRKTSGLRRLSPGHTDCTADRAAALRAGERGPGIDPQGPRAFHIWTLIHEIPEGNWAGGGNVIYYQQVKGLVEE